MSSQYRRRDYAPYDIVHFTVRGYKKQQVFHDAHDHFDFMQTLRDLLDAPLSPILLAWAQMANHQHVLLQLGADPSKGPRLMRSLSARYAWAYKDRYGTTGPVFQKPFRGKVVKGGDHLINSFAYIHLNPDASLRTTNSSHAFYAGLQPDPYIDPSIAWRVFGGQSGYLEYFGDTERIRRARAAARSRL